MKFYGEIGYTQGSVETVPGVWQEQIVERSYYGDVIRNNRQLQESEKVNYDLAVNNSISIVADAFANENIFAIRYIKWAGALWAVTNVDVQSPRLILTLGGVYNGPRPEEGASTRSAEGSDA